MRQYFQFKNGSLRRIDNAPSAEWRAAILGSRFVAWDRSLGGWVLYA